MDDFEVLLKSEHFTRGRLRAGLKSFGSRIDRAVLTEPSASGRSIPVAITGPDYNVVSEADARRLAACWNAFEGVPTAKIETMPGSVLSLLNLFEELYERIEQMQAVIDSRVSK